MHVPDPVANVDTGRPKRSNRGIGGQRDQLEKSSQIIEAQLLNKVIGHKRTRNQLEDIPAAADLPKNDLAPRAPAKRQRNQVM